MAHRIAPAFGATRPITRSPQPSDARIVVEDLPEQEARRRGSVELNLEEYDESGELSVDGPVAYDLRITRLGSTVTIVGHLEATLRAPCNRCATRVEVPVNRSFEAVFVTADTGETDGGVKLDEDDLDLDYYQGGVIDGLRLLAEQIFLELPMKLLCTEDCKGLCAQCGADLNQTDCDCEPEGDPRWGDLKALRDQF